VPAGNSAAMPFRALVINRRAPLNRAWVPLNRPLVPLNATLWRRDPGRCPQGPRETREVTREDVQGAALIGQIVAESDLAKTDVIARGSFHAR